MEFDLLPKYPKDIRITFLVLSACFIIAVFIGRRAWLLFMGNEMAGGMLHIGIIVLLGAVLISGYLFRPTQYDISDGKSLTIKRPFADMQIFFKDIAEIRILEKEDIKGVVRIYGSSGYFGYTGRFWSKSIGTFYPYATRWENLILVKTMKRTFMLSPADRAGMMEALQANSESVI